MWVIDQDTGEKLFLDSTPEFSLEIGQVNVRCDHPQKETRQKKNRGGALQFIDQCLICGDNVGFFHKHSARLANVPTWDDQIDKNFRAAREAKRTEIIQKHVRIQRGRTEGWWKQYNEYLQSEKWRQKREKVFARANGLCEGCRDKKPTQVHHLTYEHVRDEFLFELAAVCDDCHERLHPKNATTKMEDLEYEWSEGFPCNACCWSQQENNRKWCAQFDALAVEALAPDGDCGPDHQGLEGLK